MLPAPPTILEGSGDVSSGESEAKPPTPAAPSSEDSGDVMPTAQAKIHSPAPSAPAPSSEGSGDVTPAAPEAKMPSPPTPAPSVRSPGPPAPPPSSEGSEHVTPTAPEAKIQCPAPSAPAPSSEGSGDVPPAAPEGKIAPSAPAPSPEGSGDVTPAAPEAKTPSLPAPGPSVRSPGPPVPAHPSSSDAPQVLSTPLKPPQHTLRLSPPPDRPLWILPPPTTNPWEPNSKYFTLVDDTWYADESSLCPAGYEFREREGGFLRHDRGPTSPPLPPTTSRSLRDSDVIVIDDVEVNPVVASGSADHPIAIDVDIDGGVPMDVDPPQVSYSKNGDGSKGDGDYTMADLPSGQSVSNDNDDEDDEDEDEDEGIAFDMTEEQHQLAEWIKDHHVPTWGPVPYHIYHVRCKIVELSPHSPSVVLRTREQLGYSGVSTLNEDHFTPASQTGLITEVKLDQLDVWLTEINSIWTVHPNSVREVAASADTSSQESVFQPKLTNLGATLALKPSLLAIQKIGNLDQKADLVDFADSFITREVNRFDLRRSEHGVQSRTSIVTSVDEMISFLNPTIRSTLLGYIATEGTVPHTEYTGRIPWLHVEVKPITGERKGYLARVFDISKITLSLETLETPPKS
ncbi:hypothetical protein EV360DRAFT_76788 [Lentinula raphanica]|nr:hypothetical protein EV360DRAFT_76788 [Lentinula raphanica]